MSEIDPYIKTLVLTKFQDLKIPGERYNEVEIAVQVMNRVSSVIHDYEVDDIAVDSTIASDFFDDLIRSEVIVREVERFAGDYYIYIPSRYIKYREKELADNPIHAASKRIGARYYPDVFSGYRKHISEAGETPVNESQENTENLVVPASDRIVSLNHNQVQELDKQASDVIDLVSAQNAIEGSLGLRERIIGQLKAGRELIRSGEFRLYLLEISLVETLRWLADKYAKDAIGVLALDLMKTLAKKLGIEL